MLGAREVHACRQPPALSGMQFGCERSSTMQGILGAPDGIRRSELCQVAAGRRQYAQCRHNTVPFIAPGPPLRSPRRAVISFSQRPPAVGASLGSLIVRHARHRIARRRHMGQEVSDHRWRQQFFRGQYGIYILLQQ
jgi:hypothetical protein